ncbi:MAG: PAS domain S-box protein [Dehalococcoidia bacterium]|jgi:PAS domain S-box-containing protein/putative nucleotidyltransferase with HDIG domain
MNNHSLNILLVEDNPADARLIFELLKDGRGGRYELAHVDRFAKAKERLQQDMVDVVLLDLSLPDSHGLDTITGLNGHTEKMPIIVLTGLDDQALAVTALQAGAQDYLVKGQVDGDLLWRSMRYAIERKKAEEAQNASEEKYRSILEEMGEDYHELDAKGNFTFFNDTLCRMLGYTRGELDGMSYKKYTPRESWKDIVATHSEVFRTGKPRFGYPMEEIRRDGTKIFMEESIFPLRNNKAAITGLRIISKDVTERRRSEEMVQRTQRDLQLMVDSLPFGIIIVNTEDRKIRHANHTALEMADYKSMEELADRVCHQTLCAAAEGQCPILDLGQKVDRSERALLTRTGKKIPILKTAIRLKLDEEDVLLESFVDISELKQSEGERLKAVKEIEERERLYRTLVETSPDAIVLLDLNGNIIMHNKQVLAVFGVDMSEDLRGKNIIDMAIPEHREDMLKKSELITKTGDIRNLELQSYKQNGQPFYMEFSSSIILDGGKKPESVIVVFKDITSRKSAEVELEKSYHKLRKTLNDAINTLVKVVEMRDPYTAGHQQRVAALAIAIAKQLQFDEQHIEELRMAAVIHDIGKIYVPADMLSKPGKLTELEFEIIKTHAKGGYDIVKSMDFPCKIAQAILQHHERLNGSGYPHGLKDDDIILEARILAVADVVEAMASHRPYRPGLGIDKALDEIRQNAGKIYDPDVANACLKLFKDEGFTFEENSA